MAAIVNKTHSTLEALQREQWKEGKDKLGNVIGRYRSRKYAEAKFSMNSMAGFGVWDLTLTGSLGRKLKIEAVNGKLFNRSDDSKYDRLSQRVPNAFGLNKGKIEEYRGDVLKPEVSKSFRKKVLK